MNRCGVQCAPGHGGRKEKRQLMIEPSVEELMNPDVNPDITSKFELVTMVSQRSRQLNDGAELQVDFASLNPVTTALREIVAGGLKLVRNPE